MSTQVNTQASQNTGTVIRRRRSTPLKQEHTGTVIQPHNGNASTDSVKLTTKAEKPNPFSSISPKSSTVAVEKWGKGKNSSIEGILRNQGYSLKEIYAKGENGKSMIDTVAAANGLKNPNVIQPGQKLNVPTKPDSESISTADLDNGQMQSAKVSTGDTSIKATSGKDRDGTNRTGVRTQNQDADARLRSESTVGEGGRIDTSISRNGEEVNAQSTVLSRDGSSRTAVDTNATNSSSSVTVRDIDSNKNLNAESTANSVTVNNEGSDAANTGSTKIDISEGSQDGLFESGGRKIAEFFGFRGEEAKTGSATGASNVQVQRDDEGATTVTATVDGKKKTIGQTAGDNDDTLLERGGELIDDGFRWIGGLFNREGTSKTSVRG